MKYYMKDSRPQSPEFEVPPDDVVVAAIEKMHEQLWHAAQLPMLVPEVSDETGEDKESKKAVELSSATHWDLIIRSVGFHAMKTNSDLTTIGLEELSANGGIQVVKITYGPVNDQRMMLGHAQVLDGKVTVQQEALTGGQQYLRPTEEKLALRLLQAVVEGRVRAHTQNSHLSMTVNNERSHLTASVTTRQRGVQLPTVERGLHIESNEPGEEFSVDAHLGHPGDPPVPFYPHIHYFDERSYTPSEAAEKLPPVEFPHEARTLLTAGRLLDAQKYVATTLKQLAGYHEAFNLIIK